MTSKTETQKKIDALKIKNYDIIMSKTELLRQLNILETFIKQNVEKIQQLEKEVKKDISEGKM